VERIAAVSRTGINTDNYPQLLGKEELLKKRGRQGSRQKEEAGDASLVVREAPRSFVAPSWMPFLLAS
jgi:hypothetical protein